jgi:hypothetical protein
MFEIDEEKVSFFFATNLLYEEYCTTLNWRAELFVVAPLRTDIPMQEFLELALSRVSIYIAKRNCEAH